MSAYFDKCKARLAGILALCGSITGVSAQDAAPREIGAVYYAVGPDFKPLTKEAAPASGRGNFSARMKGAHAAVRLEANEPPTFLVCSVDPSRYKLYVLRSTKNSREVTITKVNIWVGGGKSVLSNSEIPITIEPAAGGCFTIVPKERLKDGEYGISPTGEEYAFTFGVETQKQPK